MNDCCKLSFFGRFCTEDGTTVLGFVHFVDGVPVYQYFNISDGLPYNGIVYTDACNGGSSPLFGVEIAGVAGFDIEMPNDGIAFTIAIENVEHSEGWTQVGTTISFTDGTVINNGAIIKVIYTKP